LLSPKRTLLTKFCHFWITRRPKQGGRAHVHLNIQTTMRYRKAILRGASGLLGIVGVVLGGASAQAGSVTYDFTTDPSAELTIAGNNPNVYHATDGNPGGFLAITHAVDSQN